MKETLCIVASHPLAARFDFDRTDCDIWGFNEILKMDWYKRADAIFQLHLEPIWRNPKNRNDPNHAHWLRNESGTCNVCDGKGCKHCDNGIYTPKKREGVTVFMQDYYENIPGCEVYPVDDIKAMLPGFEWQSANGNTGKHYLTSSVSQAIALGIYKGYKRIECWGMEMNTDTEYRYQRDGVTFWQGVALGRGIEVLAMTDIYNAPIYGFEGEVSISYEAFDERLEKLKPELDKNLQALNENKVAFLKSIETYKVDFENPQIVAQALQAAATSAFNLHIIDGAMQENERYKKRADTMAKETDGVFQFSRQEFEQAMMDTGKILNEAKAQANAVGGACQAALNRVVKEKSKTKKRTILNKFIDAAQEYIKASSIVGVYSGAQQENQNFLVRLDGLIRAAGGAQSEEVLLNA
jgi:hypothetical protein